MHLTVGVLSAAEVKRRGLKTIPAKGVTVLKPEDMVAMSVTGYPAVIATSGTTMVLAYGEDAKIVDDIIWDLLNRGARLLSIRMSIQMYLPGLESAFLDRAMDAGLRHVWAASPIAEFLARADAQIGGQNFVTLRRDN